ALGRRRLLPRRPARPRRRAGGVAGRPRRRAVRLRHVVVRSCPAGGSGAAVPGAAAPERPPRRLHRREPRHRPARRRRRARVRADPHPPQVARRHRCVVLADCTRLRRHAMDDHYDVIIIGSGAGGGTLAYRLAPTGLRVLILERGDYIRREVENWDSREVITKARYKTHEKWIDRDGQQFHPGQHYYVGGQTKFYGAILFRLRGTDFGEGRHHGGICPRWPAP